MCPRFVAGCVYVCAACPHYALFQAEENGCPERVRCLWVKPEKKRFSFRMLPLRTGKAIIVRGNTGVKKKRVKEKCGFSVKGRILTIMVLNVRWDGRSKETHGFVDDTVAVAVQIARYFAQCLVTGVRVRRQLKKCHEALPGHVKKNLLTFRG